MGLLPTTAASVALGAIGFMKAAFGLRFVAGFFAFAAGRLAAAFFIGFLAADFLAAGFFAAFLAFLAAIDESSNLMVTLSSHSSRPIGATARGCTRRKRLVNRFHSEERVFRAARIACATANFRSRGPLSSAAYTAAWRRNSSRATRRRTSKAC